MKLEQIVYLEETGILLNKSDSQYDYYSQVYDKQNAYYDEYQGYALGNLEDIKERLLKELENSRNNSYALISNQGLVSNYYLEEEIDRTNIEDCEEYLNNYFDTDDLSYDVRDIVWSAYKDENGIIHEDFIKKG